MTERIQRDRLLLWLLAFGPGPIGLIIVLLPERFTSSGWRFAFGLPGGYGLWGGILLTLGVIMPIALACRHTRWAASSIVVFIAGLIGVGLWWLLLFIVFLITVAIDPLANPIGVVVWFKLGALYWIWAYFEHKRFLS